MLNTVCTVKIGAQEARETGLGYGHGLSRNTFSKDFGKKFGLSIYPFHKISLQKHFQYIDLNFLSNYWISVISQHRNGNISPCKNFFHLFHLYPNLVFNSKLNAVCHILQSDIKTSLK